MQFSPEVIEAIFAHGKAVYPRESCGMVVRTAEGERYMPCRNDAAGNLALGCFVMNEEDQKAAEDLGEVLAIAHSHPNASADPSDADRVMCSKSEVPWIIVGVPSGVVRFLEPSEKGLPLVGRTFHHGVVDCYSLVRDYYKEKLDLELSNYRRTDDWWLRGENLYVRNFQKEGFAVVAHDGKSVVPQPHDVILMQIRSDQLNHAAVMDPDRPGHILHHLHGQLSRHDVWGGIWARHTGLILRHQSLMTNEH